MRVFCLLFLVFLLPCIGMGQNLVPNPSFEDTLYCPHATGQFDACSQWQNFGNSPDYFNICTGPINLGTPYNYGLAFQYPHCGNAMSGVIMYQRPDLANGPNYREFFGCHLISSMIVGQKYFASMYVNYCNSYHVAIACNKIGMRFSTVSFDSCCPPPINNFATIYTDSILTDTISWIKISGSFIADSAYQYISIGNFFDDMNTDTLNFDANPAYAYYFIDDVCVSTDSLFSEPCPGVTSLDQLAENKISIEPNPSNGIFIINGLSNQCNVEIYNLLGESVPFHIEYMENNIKIKLLRNDLNQTLLLRVLSTNKINTFKIIEIF